jgi:tetratricopeptide (TPR) repeat protein
VLAAPLLIYLSVRTAAVALNPAAAAALPPRDLTSLVRLNLQGIVDPRVRMRPEVVAASRDVAAAAPLAFEPFVVEARVQEQSGRLGRAIALLEEAARRRPNLLLIHAQLAAYYQAAGRSRELLAEIDFILRKSPEARRVVFPELAKLLRDRNGLRLLGEMLAINPRWRREFVTHLEQNPPRPQQALELIAAIRRVDPRANVAPERRVYVHALIGAGDFRAARAAWIETLPPAARQDHGLLVDGAFRGARIGPPFGWRFHDTANGRSGPAAGSGETYLDISYFGGANVTLAEQTLALAPGRYRLSARARTSSSITSGEIFWSLRCLPGDSEAARLPLSGLTGEYRMLTANFTVAGAGCSGQRLSLEARPGDLAAAVDAQVAALEIARAN